MLGQKSVKEKVHFLEDLKTPKNPSEINWSDYFISSYKLNGRQKWQQKWKEKIVEAAHQDGVT